LGEDLGGIEMTDEELNRIAELAAHKAVQKILEEQEESDLLLHSIPHAFGSPGIVVDEATAKVSPCRYIEYRPGKRLAFSKGIIGALSDEQEKNYCPTWEKLESPGLQRRLERWMESVDTCKKEIAEIPRGDRLMPWLNCMSRELKVRKIDV